MKDKVAQLLIAACKSSLKTTPVPEDWTMQNVRPIFLKDLMSDLGNYMSKRDK